MVILKSSREVELMREAGRVVFGVLERLREVAGPGVTTEELDRVAAETIEAAGGEALFKGVRAGQAKFPFPAVICASINEEVVHGIPGARRLKEGDIISIDCGVRLKGYCGDAAATIAIGEVGGESRRLLEVTKEALQIAVDAVRPGRRWSEIAGRMQRAVESAGFSVVRKFVGHGIGRDMHEDPKLPNYVDRQVRRNDLVLRPGMVLAVEPMVNLGTDDVEYADDSGWTVRTADGRRSAHFEHSLAVTVDGASVLTDGS